MPSLFQTRRHRALRLRSDPRPCPSRANTAGGCREAIGPHDDEGRLMDVDDGPPVPSGQREARGDQITEAADVDDPVEALEIGSLWAGSETKATGDATELADGAAPPVPEEEAVVDDAGDPADAEALSTGLEPGIDLDRLDEISDE